MNTVAMLIDWENIKMCATEYLGTAPDIVTLKKIARQFGKLTVARAYANWTDPTGWHAGDVERLAAQGVEPVFVWTRRDDRGKERATYVSDMVDLRLACDCMELLAIQPEISCYVIVSGDGALETVMAKLSAYGKRVVRVAVQNGLAVGMHVLGEERVLYDDWIKGFKMPIEAGPLHDALNRFVKAVEILRGSSGDNGLQSVKDLIRREDPQFEEERLGVPTFRHLAYLAEARGLVRVDGRREPAQAYLATETKAADNAFLPTGEMWAKFIRSLKPQTEYNHDSLKAILGNSESDSQEGISVEMARSSDIVTHVSRQIVILNKDPSARKATRDISTSQFRLNPHHPRVQVVLAAK